MALALVLAAGCQGEPASPPGEAPRIAFQEPRIELAPEGVGSVRIRNEGNAPVGPILFQAGPVTGSSGGNGPPVDLRADPNPVPTLPPGEARTVELRLVATGGLSPGLYNTSLVAGTLDGGASATLEVRFRVPCQGGGRSAATLGLTAPGPSPRQGDPIALLVEARDSDGSLLELPCLEWTVSPADAGVVTAEGRFVPYRRGSVRVEARSGGLTAGADLQVSPRGLPAGGFSLVGEGRVETRHTSDLWAWESVVYTGSWGVRTTATGTGFGNALHAWDLADPSTPARTHTVEVDARVVNDVKIREDGRIAVMTHEASNDGLNGITLLDMTDPLRPTPITRFTRGLESGIHNVWIEGDHLYLVVNGIGNGLRVLDISQPADPRVVASFYGGSSFLHDVYVRDGLAFLSHWNAGLIILDVGNGIRGGSPSNPVEVGRTTTVGGRTHNAWFWPETGYVFVGEENFDRPGIMHVVDARDLSNPQEVATYSVPGATPHNFWLDEDRGILYLAWYGNGLRALDVTGELLGELDRQGREIAGYRYAGTPSGRSCHQEAGATCTWAPQLHRGNVLVSDMNRGLMVFQPDF